MAKQIDILVVEPGKNPRPAKVEDTLEAFQKIVGGPIEAGCYLPQRVMLICNGEKNGVPAEAQRSGFGGERRGKGARRSFPLQRETEWSGFRPDDIAGTFLLCSFEGEQLISLNDEQREKFEVYFALPGKEGGTSA